MIPMATQSPCLAEAADFTLAATPLAAVAGETSQDITAAPQSPWGSLPAGSAPIESLRDLGEGQPLAGGYCLIQLSVCIRVCIWESVPCKRWKELVLEGSLVV